MLWNSFFSSSCSSSFSTIATSMTLFVTLQFLLEELRKQLFGVLGYASSLSMQNFHVHTQRFQNTQKVKKNVFLVKQHKTMCSFLRNGFIRQTNLRVLHLQW